MASEVGAKSGSCGCFDCFRPSKAKESPPVMSNELRSKRMYTNKEIQDFETLVKANEEDKDYQVKSEQGAEEDKVPKAVFKKIHPNSVRKNE